MILDIIRWSSVGNYRLLFVNSMIAVLCLAIFGNKIVFCAIIGLILLIINGYVGFLIINYAIKNLYNDIKTSNAATTIYRFLLLKVIYIIGIIMTIFGLYLIWISTNAISLSYIGGSFICFFEVMILITATDKIQEVNGRFIRFLDN